MKKKINRKLHTALKKHLINLAHGILISIAAITVFLWVMHLVNKIEPQQKNSIHEK